MFEYENLPHMMSLYRVSIQDIATCIDVTYGTALLKKNGQSEFTFGEAEKIRDAFFKGIALSHLFKRVEIVKPA